MNNAIVPAKELVIAGKTYEILYDFEAIAEAEDITDRPLLTGLTRKQIDRPAINFVRAMLFAGLRRRHPDMTLKETSALVTADTIGEIWGNLVVAWAESRQREKEASQADPQTAQS